MNELKIGKLVTLIGAGVVFIFSFLPWMSIGGYASRSAWGSGFFPMASWAPLLALVVGFLVAADMFKFINLPDKYWEFSLDHVVILGSGFAFVVTLSYLIMDKGGASIGVGLILCFLGTLAMVGGFVMDKLGVGLDPNATNGNLPFEQPGFPSPTPPGASPAPGQAAGYPTPGAQPAPPQAMPPQAEPYPPAQTPPAQAPPVAPPTPSPAPPPQQPEAGSF